MYCNNQRRTKGENMNNENQKPDEADKSETVSENKGKGTGSLAILFCIVIVVVILLLVLYYTESDLDYEVDMQHPDIIVPGDTVRFSVYDIRHGWFETGVTKVICNVWLETEDGYIFNWSYRAFGSLATGDGFTTSYNTTNLTAGSYYIRCDLAVFKDDCCNPEYFDKTWGYFKIQEVIE
jgi:hypothetical protein